MPHIAVIGAGVTGVTTAYALSKRGSDVTLFDRNRYAGLKTSFANRGPLSASNAETWNKVSTILQGLKWMMRRDAPLLVNPKPGWHKYSWMAEFIRHIGNYEANTLETIRLAMDARKYVFAVAEDENIDFTMHFPTPESRDAAPRVSILDDATKIVTSRLGHDRFRVAGAAEFNGYNRDIRNDRIEPLVRWTREQFPRVVTGRAVAWSGLRPMMPGMLPHVGPGKQRGIFYSTGHGHLGWTLSAATAQLTADAVAQVDRHAAADRRVATRAATFI